VQHARNVTFTAMLLAGWSGFAPANESVLPPTAGLPAISDIPSPSALPPPASEVLVEAPEPRYVAPTLRDRIGRIWAPVFINGQGPFRLVLDTGSNHSVINQSVATALGIVPAAGSMVMMQGVTGSASVPIINVDSVIVGDLELRAQRLPIVMDALGGAEGVLGGKGLHDKRIFIDFGRDQITILRSRLERAPRGFRTIPVKMRDGLLIAEVRVGAMRVNAIIDTGAQMTIANLAFREALARRRRAGEFTSTDIIGTTLDVQRGDLVSAPTISFGPMEIRRARIITGDVHIFHHWKMTERPVLLIGMDVLGQFDILIIDYRRKELHVRMRGMQ
jgi:predicted aspartyl protease